MIRFQVDLTPEQEARRSAMVERLHKLGGVESERMRCGATVCGMNMEVDQE